jgi:hypothetical protein
MRPLPSLVLALPLAAAVMPAFAQVPVGYAGTPWHDTTQAIPGRLLPQNYDKGNINVTWFDTDAHIGAYTARNPDGVDLDPVHPTDQTVPGSTVQADPGGIYWGWLANGEWLKMTVDVKQAGTYNINVMAGTAMTGTSFKVDALQGTDSVSSGAMVLPFSGTCPLECYHYWNYVKAAGQIQLKAGIQVIRIAIVKSGYNIEYVDFEAAGATGVKARAAQSVGPTVTGVLRADAGRFDAEGRARAAGKSLRVFTR